MKFLSHSNGLHKVKKEKVSKIIIVKRIVLSIIALLFLGFSIQWLTQTIGKAKIRSRFKHVKVDKIRLEYKLKQGDEFTIVFDGDIGANLYQWDSVCDVLDKDYNFSTFVYNRQGYGFNEFTNEVTIKEQAKQLRTVLKKSGAREPYILVGEEYGSLVLSNFATIYPDSVAGIVMIDPLYKEKVSTDEYRNTIKNKYYRSIFESIGSRIYLTKIMSKMGLAMENEFFRKSLEDHELEEFNVLRNDKNYKDAVKNEIGNIYNDNSLNQEENTFSDKPLYVIKNEKDNSENKLGNPKYTVIYTHDKQESPYSIIDPESIVNGINSVAKNARRLSKLS